MANEDELLQMHNLKPAPGAKKDRTRVGRGEGSKGKTSGRGAKGQTKRNHVRPGFEGGQMPLYRRLPKRGFTNIHAKNYAEVNISQLNRFEAGDVVDPVSLIEKGILKNVRDGVRILGNGELDKAVTVKAHGFTKTAQEKIEAAGGKVEVL